MTLPKSIKELRNPDTLKSGHIAKISNGRLVVVKRNKSGKASYIKASKSDIKCSKTLKKNVKQMLDEVKNKKNKRIKTYPQALAIAYSKTQKSFPRCELVKKKTLPKSKSNSKRIVKRTIKKNMMGGKRRTHKVQTGGGNTYVKLQRKILKLLIKKGYILKQDDPNKCSLVKSGKIKSLYDRKSNIPINITKIRKKQANNMNFFAFFNLVNRMIATCSIEEDSHPVPANQYSNGFRYSKKTSKEISYDTNEINKAKDETEKMEKLYTFVKTLS